jgi:tRNA threonylcarbamoyladenosine biosynthesis protein TsaE
MDENKKTIVYALQESDLVIQELKKRMANGQVFAFIGPLGAGKTTIIRQLLRDCGVLELITSPTFMYVNEYENAQQQKFYHFDLYRINSVEEFQFNGFDEYLYQPNSWSLIEWPEVIAPLVQHGVCFVSFDYHDDADKRMVTIQSVL